VAYLQIRCLEKITSLKTNYFAQTYIGENENSGNPCWKAIGSSVPELDEP
jgi:long-chain-alcohol oxidase